MAKEIPETKAMPYFPTEELREKRDAIKEKFKRENYASWAVKEKWAFNYLRDHLSKGEPILDVGCATGFFLKELLDAGFNNIFGVDVDDYILVPEIKKRFRMVDASEENLPLEDESFGAVTALEVIDHLENPFRLFREAYRILKKGGIFICLMDNPVYLWNRLNFLRRGELIEWHKDNNHLSILTGGILNKTLFSMFDLEKTIYSKGYLPYFSKIEMPRLKLFGRHICFFTRKK